MVKISSKNNKREVQQQRENKPSVCIKRADGYPSRTNQHQVTWPTRLGSPVPAWDGLLEHTAVVQCILESAVEPPCHRDLQSVTGQRDIDQHCLGP